MQVMTPYQSDKGPVVIRCLITVITLASNSGALSIMNTLQPTCLRTASETPRMVVTTPHFSHHNSSLTSLAVLL